MTFPLTLNRLKWGPSLSHVLFLDMKYNGEIIKISLECGG